MGDVPLQRPAFGVATGVFTPLFARVAVLACCLAGIISGVWSVSPMIIASAVEAGGPDLTRLLRGMAAIKALLCVGLLAGVAWRLDAPISVLGLAAYGTSAFAMGAGLALTWSIVSLGLGGLLLHAGLFGGLVLLARDKAVGTRFHQMLIRR